MSDPSASYWPIALVRFGAAGEVARFGLPEGMLVRRGDRVVVAGPRGEIPGIVLERLRRSHEPSAEEPTTTGAVLRKGGDGRTPTATAASEYDLWQSRIAEWQIDVELLDVETSLDGRTTLFVLNERGAEPTKLALRAVTENLGLIEVQPMDAEGVVAASGGGGCGSCGKH